MFGASFSIEKKIKKPKNRKKFFFWNFQKIITRKILIVSKNFTFKKMLRISFSIGKKIKKGGYKIEGRGGVCESDSTKIPKKKTVVEKKGPR